MIDHTILKPDATHQDLRAFCDEARQYGFRSVCVNSVHVPFIAPQLRESGVRVCSVIGFPFGAMPATIKAAETGQAIKDGAEEIDMVLQIGALKDGLLDDVRADIEAVREACSGAVLKVIIEACLLTDHEKREACRLSIEAGADYVKTSTGFSSGGATADDVALMRKAVGPGYGVKASGGIRTLAKAQEMIAAGATRIGTSSGVALVTSKSTEAESY